MENTNEMTIIFDSRPANEALARVAVASFCTQLNPTLEEVSDLKTAVSEAVTNCIIHGYEGEVHKIRVDCSLCGQELKVDITDHGTGIPDIKKAMEPLFTTRPDKDRSGMGFTFMEAFMDEVSVESEVGRGTTVHMKKIIRRSLWIVLLPSSGVHTRGIKRQEIFCLRKIQGLYTVWPDAFWEGAWRWRICSRSAASDF